MKNFILKYKYVLLGVLALSVLALFIKTRYGEEIKAFYNPEAIKNWVLSFGSLSFLVFILMQILQVVLFFIPGEVVQGAAGYIFGTVGGAAISLLGITLGSIGTFLIARRFGDSLLHKILPQKDYIKIKALIDRPKNELILFMLYLIPGFPKDVLGYVAGITPIKLKWFVLFSTVARIPGIVMSAYIGSNLYSRNYIMVAVVVVVMAAILIIGLLKGEKIVEKLRSK